MMLTAFQVLQFALSAGFTPSEAITATAIAHAESGFNTSAIGDVNLTEPGEKSVGLWQINYRPSRDRRNPLRDPSLNQDPFHNAQAAYAISLRGVSFRPWSTYTSGAYLRYIPEAIAALNSIPTDSQQEDNVASSIAGFCPTPTGKGYWVIFSDGAVFGFGDAEYHGRPELVNGVWQPVLPQQVQP